MKELVEGARPRLHVGDVFLRPLQRGARVAQRVGDPGDLSFTEVIALAAVY
jgi:hypothetical protein